MANLFLLMLFLLALLMGYALHLLLKRFIDPRISAAHFILYILLHFVSVFGVVYCVSLLLFTFGRHFNKV